MFQCCSCIAPSTSTEIVTNKEANPRLIQTLGQQTSSENNSKSQFSCDRCGSTFKSRDTFRNHQRRKCVSTHLIATCTLCEINVICTYRRDCNPVPKCRSPSNRVLFACTYPGCKRIFSIRHSLISHIKSHTTEKPFSCLHCGQQFKYASNLKIHSHSCEASRTNVVNSEEMDAENLGTDDDGKQPSPQNLESVNYEIFNQL